MPIFYRLCFLFIAFLACSNTVLAQRIILLEKAGSARTQKFYEGQFLEYRLKDDNYWYTGEIMNLRTDRNLIEMRDRFVELDKIDALLYRRSWAPAIGVSLATFGVSWSGFALVGNLTDGDPTTNYRTADAIVSGISIGLGYSIYKLFARKVVKLGKKRRLRMVDISF